ncbi:hypothetical protein RHMOL_Rhmol08G0159800 [Rhododendron molle]|uniref:Uncharacterized protein n=1 Tax=Rhododendron molle TaxID=49168 RepID=A0ACC0MQ45_RHOML|nr:hypothetical protein RHMOL_Rhmol08G0159800 [Rhododendron molle]
MADNSGNGGSGDVIDHPEDRGGPMEIEINDQLLGGTVASSGAVVTSGSDNDIGRDQQQDVGHGSDQRAVEAEPRATEETGAAGHSVEPLDPSTTVEGSVMTSSGPRDAGGSGTGGDEAGPIKSPPRDPAKGKGVVVEEGETTEVPVTYREEDVLFRPAVTSSSHGRITKHDIAEHLSDEALVKLLDDNPIIGEIVLKAKEDQAKEIAAAEVAERAEREQRERKEPLREAEAEERAGAEAQWPRVKAVAEPGAVIRPAFSAEAYIPPTPHLFVPSGFAAYVPRRTEYDAELMLRDPKTHISNT